MSIDLSGAFAKLSRAEEHVGDVEREIRYWRSQNQNPITHHHNADKTEYYFHVTWSIEPDLTRWAVIAGDCVHALRSSLDHAMWACAQVEGLPREWRGQFPIFKDESWYRREVDKQLAGIKNSDVIALVDRVQPWRHQETPYHHSLWIVHDLDLIDKHRTLPVVPIVPQRITLDAFLGHDVPKSAVPPTFIAHDRPIENNALLFTMYTPTPPTEGQMKLDLEMGIGFEYRGEVPGGLTGTFKNLCKDARRIVEQVGDLFA